MIRKIPIIAILSLIGCVDTFSPNINQADIQPLIIDALITNENLRHKVVITRASDIDSNEIGTFVENALVTIKDSNDNSFDFIYIDSGEYLGVDSFSATFGDSYKLLVSLDGIQYESTFEELKPVSEINNIDAYYSVESFQSETGDISVESRINFTVDLELPSNEESYFRFDWNATYEARTPSQGSGVCWTERDEEPPLNLDIGKTCYITETPSSFLKLFTSKGVESTSIKSIDIFAVNPNRRFQSKYSPEITLYNISKRAYDFWEAVENQIANTGSLFDTPPSPIIGNIKAINNSDSRVIGIFEVASASKRRAFFPQSIVERQQTHYDADCILEADPFGQRPARPFYCCECTLLPNSNDVKPSYWEN